ncbi:hypothetical protein VB774_16210 [Pseudanabaena galeata UHCC 0370]|uniref:Uncharacterized protein n=1 Tax=Pseudanabaena galeata UHCC 0370 TaxID=3110310 RepID=A0ABU5TMB4_9CYAN|nr:hypothetical protein [Pseudanabaena galeata]MEA5479166.1 hypothetical protein [Pseudanabaena galeata UHCC 0370]
MLSLFGVEGKGDRVLVRGDRCLMWRLRRSGLWVMRGDRCLM